MAASCSLLRVLFQGCFSFCLLRQASSELIYVCSILWANFEIYTIHNVGKLLYFAGDA